MGKRYNLTIRLIETDSREDHSTSLTIDCETIEEYDKIVKQIKEITKIKE